MSDLQSNLAEFIRRLGVDDDRLDQLERRTTALSQGIRNLWTDGMGGGGFCLTTITGKIVGCDAVQAPLASSQLRVVGHTTGKAYGTFAVMSGTFSLDLILDAADTSIDLYATGPGVRFQESAAQTKFVSHCSTGAAMGAITTSPAAGYHCHSEFPYPLADSLNLVDPVFGNRTAAWAVSSGVHPSSPGAPLWWTPIVNTATIAGTCPSAVTPLLYTFLASTANIGPSWWYRCVSNFPPVCPNTLGPTDGGVGSSPIWRTGTPPGVATKMDYTWTYPASSGAGDWLYGGISGTLRLYEP